MRCHRRSGVVGGLHLPLDEEGEALRSEHSFETDEVPRQGHPIGSRAGHRERGEAEVTGDRPDVLGAQAQRCRHQVGGSLLNHPSPHRTSGRLGLVDHRHEFEIAGTERNDPVAGSVPGMPPSQERGQPVLDEQVTPGAVAIGDRDDDMIDCQHPLRLSMARSLRHDQR